MSVNGIYKTYVVTFPRCGHHLMVRGLQTLLQDELVYSEGYKVSHNMENCPFVNLQKAHDLDLAMQIDQNFRYIVQIRESEGALRSWYRMLADQGLKKGYESWRAEKIKFYSEWVDKWVNSDIQHRLVVNYDEFIVDKIRTIIRVADFISEVDYKHRIPYLGYWSSGENLHRRGYKHLI